MKKKAKLISRTITIEIVDKDALWGQIGLNIVEARKKHGLTQEHLAKIIHLSRTSVANLEAGNQRCPLDTLYDIASASGIAIQELLP